MDAVQNVALYTTAPDRTQNAALQQDVIFYWSYVMLLSFENISKNYGAHPVLENITATVQDDDRIGLIGRNGTGKSTLLNLLVGDLEPDEGTVRRAQATIGFLRQNSGLDMDGTIRDEMRGVFAPLLAMEAEMRAMETRIAKAGDAAESTGLTDAYGRLQTLFEQRGGYEIDVRIETVLTGMGFAETDRETPIAVLSGGEKTRLALCKLLLEEPDLLMLDEPTNHLDFKTLQWLEAYLQGYKGALLVVSHDRYFLDQLCSSIWELEWRALETYPGNYSKYVSLKAERLERRQKEYEIQQAEIAELKDFVARNMVRASTSNRAKARQKQLDRMEVLRRPKPPPRPAKIHFTYKREPVKDVLHVEGLTLSVGEEEGSDRKTLCENVDFSLSKGDKIALIGDNGVGKSTFLKAIQKRHTPDAGRIEWGRNTDVSYFEQDDGDLDGNKTTLDALWDRFPQENEQSIRTVLGNVQLTGENVFKKVRELSGGERARLKFAILLLSGGNVLLLDEPTNHLDLDTKEVLDIALREYTGTLVVISHDRYLLNRFPTAIAEMHSDGFRVYKGNYEYYRTQAAAQPAGTPATAAEREPKKTTAATTYYCSKEQRREAAERQRRISELETQIEEYERVIFRLDNEIADPEVAADFVQLQEKCDALEEVRQQLNDNLAEWAELLEEDAGE